MGDRRPAKLADFYRVDCLGVGSGVYRGASGASSSLVEFDPHPGLALVECDLVNPASLMDLGGFTLGLFRELVRWLDLLGLVSLGTLMASAD